MERPVSRLHRAGTPASGSDRLESWKQIAEYLERDIRTVQRWERTRGLPVRRLPGGERARIYALRSELDGWWDSRGAQITHDEGSRQSLPTREPLRWLLAAVLAGIVLVAVGLLQRWAALPTALRPVALTSYSGMETTPSLSPDGNRVAFAWNGEKQDNFDIYVAQIGVSGTPLRLTTDPHVDGGPAWSPDDRWIAFWRQDVNSVAVFLIPSLGGPERKLIDIPRASALSWGPDAKWLAFAAQDSPEGPSSIWAMNAETGERHRLTTFVAHGAGGDSPLGDSVPAVSPDGRTLAFARQVKGYVYELHVQQLKRDLWPEGQSRRLTERRYAAVAGISWTPTGREVVYGAGSPQMHHLWRVPVSGRKDPERLPWAPPAAIQPAIGNSLPRLVYSWWLINSNVWRQNIHTGERSLLIGSTYETLNPHYSSDGQRIVFQSNRSGSSEIWSCDVEGTNCHRITFFDGPLCGAPRWSPDGLTIAFDSRAEGQPDIYLVAADGGYLRRLTNHAANDIVPSWSHDGRQIYFSSDRSGHYELWRIPKDGGDAVQLTKSGGFAGFESPDGKYIYYTKSYLTSSSSRYFYQGLFNLPGHFHQDLFRMPVEGGQETRVLQGPVGWMYAVVSNGVYFQSNERTIEFLDIATGRTSRVAVLDKPFTGIAVSPDEAYVAWSQLDRASLDLMWVEGFR